MPKRKDCLRCSYVGNVCKNCGRVKGQPKGSPMVNGAASSSLVISHTPQTTVEVDSLNWGDEPVPSGSSDAAPISSDASISTSAPEAEPAPAVAEARPTSVAVESALSAPPPAATFDATPAHSPLGGSSAERYLRCSGSVELLKLLRPEEGDEEWTVEGHRAHELAATCLNAGLDAFTFLGQAEYDHVTPNMVLAVQTYLDYVRSRPGRMDIEYKLHCPEIHQLMYGTVDCALYGVVNDGWLEIVDYKNGAGVVVPVVENTQLKYYAAMYLVKNQMFDPEMPVRLTIVQPNAWHDDGHVRSWETTAGAVLEWVERELVPGIEATQSFDGWYFDMGEHCRFCPAKIACPAFVNLKHKVVSRGAIVSYEEVELLQMLIKQYRKDAFARLMAGEAPEAVGAKLVYGKANRVWKDGADQTVVDALGHAALSKPELLSPAQIEALPGGKALVARWAYKPEGTPTIASVGDERTAAPSNLGSQVWGGEHFQKALAQ